MSYFDGTTKIISFEIRLDFGLILAAFLALVLFGILYNRLVDYLISKKYAEGFMSLVVACGVFFTLVGVAIVSLPAAILVLVAFFASGLPMIIGSISRYIHQREKFQQALIAEARRHE